MRQTCSIPRPMCATCTWTTAILVAGLLVAASTGLADNIEEEPIGYGKRPLNDPIAQLQKRMANDELKLTFEDSWGYLRSVLSALEIPESSQTLVFSKTSLQHTKIFPRMPRALYFNDETYVGFVRSGEVLEVATTDPVQGPVFYTLRQMPRDRPRFEAQTHDCLQCHTNARFDSTPAHLMRSVFVGRDGRPILRAGSFRTNDSSPMDQRWGGWYVSGTYGSIRHMGNVLAEDQEDPTQIDREIHRNITDLKPLFNTWMYVTPHSDVVALMMLGHQTHVHNVMAYANYHVRRALYRQKELAKLLGETPADGLSDSTRQRVEYAADKLLQALLMVDEATFDGPIEGSTAFQQDYESKGPTDDRGRSLRQLDLQRRLFLYPCSPLIYSEAFDALPAPLRDRVLERLLAILRGEDDAPAFARLTDNDRRSIRDILLATKKDLPAAWRQGKPLATE